MKTKYLFMIIPFLLLAGCSDLFDSDDEYGYVVFYTDVHYYLNCGMFDVDVHIDDRFTGALHRPWGPRDTIVKWPQDSVPNCNTTDTMMTLKVKLKSGRHTYLADFDCGQYLCWEDSFYIKEDSCAVIFLKTEKQEE
jgi:hypothetical protein